MQVELSIVVTLVTCAITAGVALGKQAAHTERLKSLERFRERAGARLGILETQIALERSERKLTQGKGVPVLSTPTDLQAIPREVTEEASSGGDS